MRDRSARSSIKAAAAGCFQGLMNRRPRGADVSGSRTNDGPTMECRHYRPVPAMSGGMVSREAAAPHLGDPSGAEQPVAPEQAAVR